MVSIWEVAKRAETGPIFFEKEFDVEVLPSKLMELIKQYDIKYDPNEIVPSDNRLADNLFNAGLELFLNIGIHCYDTDRLIKFDESEVKSALKKTPSKAILGEGKDAVTIFARKISDKRPPIIIGGPYGVPTSAEVWEKINLSYATEPLIDILCSGTLPTIEGIQPKIESPIAIKAAQLRLAWAREVIKEAKRPGMPLCGPGGLRAISEMFESKPDGMRKCDIRAVPLNSELKTNYDLLTKTVHFLEYGGSIMPLFVTMLGGYAGGPEGCAIVGVASHLAALLAYHGHSNMMGVHHMRYQCRTTRECFWVWDVVGQAISRNTNLIQWASLNAAAAGPCTDMLLYEAAAFACATTPCGWNPAGIGSAGGAQYDRATPVEVKLMAEVAHSTIGLKREDSNELVKEILKLYEDRLGNPPLGKSFQECMDMTTLKPTEEHRKIYTKVREQLKNIGLELT